VSKKYSCLLPSFIIGIALPLFLASAAHAHVGTHETNGFIHGFQHPLGGLDHILAMVAVGLWAVQLGRRAIWALPVTFMGVMLVGGAIGINTSLTLPGLEPAILASDLVLGGLILATIQMPIAISASLVGIMAIFHGYAHGAEMPTQASSLEYAAGFIGATALLHAMGLGTALLIQKYRQAQLVQIAGASIVIASLVMITKFALGN
jgi:urease accessory protein